MGLLKVQNQTVPMIMNCNAKKIYSGRDLSDATNLDSCQYSFNTMPNIPQAAPIVPFTVPLILETPIRRRVVTAISR